MLYPPFVSSSSSSAVSLAAKVGGNTGESIPSTGIRYSRRTIAAGPSSASQWSTQSGNLLEFALMALPRNLCGGGEATVAASGCDAESESAGGGIGHTSRGRGDSDARG